MPFDQPRQPVAAAPRASMPGDTQRDDAARTEPAEGDTGDRAVRLKDRFGKTARLPF